MNFNITVSDIEKQQGCFLLGIFEDKELSTHAKRIDKMSDGLISKILQQGLFQGKTGQILPLYQPDKGEAQSILLIGCGKSTPLSPTAFHKIILQTIKALTVHQIKKAVCFLGDLPVEKKSVNWKIKQMVLAVEEGLYRFDLFKTNKEPEPSLEEFTIVASSSQQEVAETAVKEGLSVAHGMILTKNLANLPSNICTPTFLAEQAKDLAKQYSSLSVTILEEKEMKKLGMGALLAVSQGSAEDAKLICLEYKGSGKKRAPYVFVGKGITFDTGGNSLKPADSMVGMKYDMCGAATVLGTIKVVAELKLPIHVVGIIPAVENMPGGTAYKPEDILKSLSGQTIEVISTDAEGRLILADALTYSERYEPQAVIDIATLTGAVVIALGFHATGLLSNNDALAKELLKAGEESHDRVWQLPLWEEYQEQIKSPFADMANTGGRAAGTITAGCFLSRFAKKFPWAHLDVAGTAAMMSGTSDRMATGRPVPLLVQYLLDQIEK